MYTLKKDNICIEINENPLEIRSLKVDGVEMCYQQDGSWKKNWPFLFPVVGRIRDGKVTYDGQEYLIPRHGFFRDIDNFKIEDEADGLVTFSAASNGKFLDKYPFEFEIKNQIEILNNEVIVSYEVINLDEKVMLFQMGHHPAFVSKPDGILTFEKPEGFTKEYNNDGLYPSKVNYEYSFQTVTIKDLSFENSACYFTQDLQSSWVRYQDDERSFKISLDDYNSFLLWSDSNEQRFLCIEPWMGIPDPYDRKDYALENKPRMMKLEPQEAFGCELKIQF